MSASTAKGAAAAIPEEVPSFARTLLEGAVDEDVAKIASVFSADATVQDLLLGNFSSAELTDYAEMFATVFKKHKFASCELLAVIDDGKTCVVELLCQFRQAFVWDLEKGKYVEKDDVEVNVAISLFFLRSDADESKAARLRLYMPLGWCSGDLVLRPHDPLVESTDANKIEWSEACPAAGRFHASLVAGELRPALDNVTDTFVMREPSEIYHEGKDAFQAFLKVLDLGAGVGLTHQLHNLVKDKDSNRVAVEFNVLSFLGVPCHQPAASIYEHTDDGQLLVSWHQYDQVKQFMMGAMFNIVKGLISKKVKGAHDAFASAARSVPRLVRRK